MNDLELQGLTASDLELNRAGRISPLQRDRLRVKLSRLQLMPLMIAAFGITIPILGVGLFYWLRTGQAVAMAAPVTIALFLAPIFLLWYFLGYRRAARALDGDGVVTLEGPIENKFLGYYWSNFFIRVQNTRLRGYGPGWSEAANSPWYVRIRELYRDKTPVRVFYLAASRTMVAMEPATRRE
jgi:hypothetical protein